MKLSLLVLAFTLAGQTFAAPQPLYVIAHAKVKPAGRVAFIEAAKELVELTRREPGNVSYSFSQSADEPTEFAFQEVWETEADSDIHMKGQALGDFFNKVKALFEQGYPQIKHFRPIE